MNKKHGALNFHQQVEPSAQEVFWPHQGASASRLIIDCLTGEFRPLLGCLLDDFNVSYNKKASPWGEIIMSCTC